MARVQPKASLVEAADAPSDFASGFNHDLLLRDAPPVENYSDYGSELDTDGEQILSELLSGLEGKAVDELVLESILEDENHKDVLYLPRHSSQESRVNQALEFVEGRIDVEDLQVSHSTRKLCSIRFAEVADVTNSAQ
jgi:hypothetical protein